MFIYEHLGNYFKIMKKETLQVKFKKRLMYDKLRDPIKSKEYIDSIKESKSKTKKI